MLVSRGKDCKKSDCKCYIVDPDGYCIVHTESHLEYQKFDCGCIIAKNKYYNDLNYASCVWDEIFEVQLSQGEKLVKLTVQRFSKRK